VLELARYLRALSTSYGTRGNIWRHVVLSYPEFLRIASQNLRSCGGYQLELHIEAEISIPPIRLQRADKLLEVPPTPILETLGNKLLFFLEFLLCQGFSYTPVISKNME